MRHVLQYTCMLFLSASAAAQVVTINSSGAAFCTGAPMTFSAVTNDTGLVLKWQIAPNLVIEPSTDAPVISVRSDRPITYTLTLSASGGSMTVTTSITFSVSRSAVAAFNASLDATGFPARLILTNFSTNSTKYSWQFSDKAEPDSLVHTVKPYSAPGTYSVTLVAFGRNGCHSTSSYSFEIPASSSLVLPNIFTPNEDGVNDIFRPIARGIFEMKVWIYNRDRILMSTWDRVNGAWDGRTTSGEDCSAGVYFVSVEAKGFDGQEYRKQGTLTLLR
jgi:gliding motility-associated-like protein